jgi:hypothetical protein
MTGLVMKKPSPDPSYSSTESIVAGKVMADRMTPALAASDLSVPVLTPLVMELERQTPPERLQTGISGLDQLLNGGFSTGFYASN